MRLITYDERIHSRAMARLLKLDKTTMNTVTLSAGAPKRIGFISTRFHGTDGVTLEAGKWAHILSTMGHSCFWMAGLLDTPPETSFHAPLAFFSHPEVAALQTHSLAVTRARAVTNEIQAIKEQLKDETLSVHRKIPASKC